MAWTGVARDERDALVRGRDVGIERDDRVGRRIADARSERGFRNVPGSGARETAKRLRGAGNGRRRATPALRR
jgi:hypothetical protein